MQTQTLEYQDQHGTTLEAFYAHNRSPSAKPLVLIAHDWSGRNDFAQEKAKKIADLGYVGFALDMFGKGKLGTTKEEKSALIAPLISNRQLLLDRLLAALNAAKQLEMVDKNKIAAMGFCFGGLCVLDLARSGAKIQGVVSFHGLLNAPKNVTVHPELATTVHPELATTVRSELATTVRSELATTVRSELAITVRPELVEGSKKTITAKVLAMHGFNDPMVPPEQILSFAQEMTQSQADWQFHIYGNTMHGFTNPQANDPGFGTVYNTEADQRSWLALKDFLAEIF